MTAAISSGVSTRNGACVAAAPREERRELVGAVGEHRDPQGLQRLQGEADVEDALDPGGDHGDVGRGQLGEVGADVEGAVAATVDTAETTGDEHPDAGEGRQSHRRGHGGGTVTMPGDHDRKVANAHLARRHGLVREQLQVGSLEADPWAAAQHGDGGRHGAEVPDELLDPGGHLDVLRIRHAVADDRALQRDDRASVAQRLGHLVGENEGGIPASSPWCSSGCRDQGGLDEPRGEIGADGVRAGERQHRGCLTVAGGVERVPRH